MKVRFSGPALSNPDAWDMGTASTNYFAGANKG